MKILPVLVALVSSVSVTALASGFRCESPEGYRVKLYNHVQPENGTRNPAYLVISSEMQGTLLVRGDGEINKTNRLNVVRYTVEGNSAVNADMAILQIRFLEGREDVVEGTTVTGQLIFIKEDDKAVYTLSCERYLKGLDE